MREIEAKLRVTSHDAVRERLRSLGATHVRSGIETNVIYDRPDGSLRKRGMGLRVRAVSADHGAAPPATITVKGPRTADALKTREELEVHVDDPATAAAMLEMLGYRVILRYEKRRESWTLGTCRVELDTPPHIGLFVEIEGPTADAVQEARARLDLADAPHVESSYVRMLRERCREKHLDPLDLNLP
jgi:adenylate cyclase class 2